MASNWQKTKEEWLEKARFSDGVSTWALGSLKSNEEFINSIDDNLYESKKSKFDSKNLENQIKGLRKSIKNDLNYQESFIDDITLSSPNSYKVQVSVPSSISYLMKLWAVAEGRDLSSIALQCIEIGLREMKSKGVIPSTAIDKYNHACEKRIALSEVSRLWEKHEEGLLNYLNS